MCSTNINEKEDTVFILISDKVDFRTRNKAGYRIKQKGLNYQNDIMLNIYAPNNRVSNT